MPMPRSGSTGAGEPRAGARLLASRRPVAEGGEGGFATKAGCAAAGGFALPAKGGFAATGITAHSSASAPPLLPKSSSAPRRKRAGPRCSERSICERGHAAAERAAQLHVAGTTWLLSPLPSASEHRALVELFAATTYQSRNGPFHGDLASVFVLEEVSACFLKVRPVV